MAVDVTVDIPNETEGQYEQIVATVFPDGKLPEGWLLHLAGPTETGWRVLNVVPYKPIVGLIAPMGEGEATWPATSVSLVSGEHDAVLIDAALTPQDAGRVVDWIRATGKHLTTIYITHGHGDHFFGLNTILDAFPGARAVTAAAVIPDTQGQLSPDLMQFWNTVFPGQIPQHPIVPDALDGDVIDLEGHQLRIITVGQSDTNPSTIVYIPSLAAVISGDVAYNGIHQWLAQTDHQKRMQWIASVEQGQGASS